MRGIIGALVAGLLVGCGGVEGEMVCETPTGGTMNCRCMPGEYFYCS